MTECKRVRELLALRPDDWSGDERRRVEAHLEVCGECAAGDRAYAEQDRLIRVAPRVGLNAAQQDPLFSRIGRQERRHTLRARFAAALGTVAALGVLVVLALALSALFRGRAHPGAVQPTPAGTAQVLPGPGVADLLRDPPAPSETVEVDAYFSGVGAFPMTGPPPPSEDWVACPTYWAWQVALTDRPFPATVQYLSTTCGNVLPDDAPWLAATTPEAIQPGKIILPQLPYHARFRGHLGDPALADCPNAGRIFVVEEVVTVYAQEPPDSGLYPRQPPADYAAWPRYHDTRLGYSLPYPPDWTVDSQKEMADEEGTLATVTLLAPQWPDYPVVVRVHASETQYDQYVASAPPLLQGEGFGVYEQGWAFGGQGEGPRLAGFQVDRQAGPSERSAAALFSGGGYTYELALRFPLGFDAPQPLLTAYTAIVEGFRLDRPPGPTPTPPVKQTLGPGPFLGQDEALARVQEREGQQVELLDAKLVSEAEARNRADPCSSFMSHPDGVWLLTVRGQFEGMARTMLFFLDATTGEQLCGEEINLEATPEPTLYSPLSILSIGARLAISRLRPTPGKATVTCSSPLTGLLSMTTPLPKT